MSGIVRRIDELGRIVIPKEIRKVLNIKQGSTLSIQTSGQSIVLNKFCPLKTLADYIQPVANTLFESSGYGVIIADQESILACVGVSKAEFLDKQLSQDFVQKMSNCRCYYNHEIFDIVDMQFTKIYSMLIAPILEQGNMLGCIVLVDKQPNKQISTAVESMAKCMATYLANLLS